MCALFDKFRDMAVRKALAEIKDRLLNPALKGIGIVTQIAYRDKKLSLTCQLNGLEDSPIEVSVGTIAIADDASQLRLGDFEANRAFAQNALNLFAARTYDVPDTTAVRFSLKTAKKVLGL
ncbi:MAG: hypothetical protein IJU37_10665 [Desulfovibrio sp.]|nr:hypothetical protein [Desulfovibrio sp.]